MKIADTRILSRTQLLKGRTACLRSIWIFLAILVVSGLRAQDSPREFALRGMSPEFWKLLSGNAKLETVVSGFGFTEGPVWDPSGFVYVSDETLNKILRVYP